MDVIVNLGSIDWPMLASQKLSLLEAIGVLHDEEQRENLQGLVHLIDHLQDEAEKAGHNVVWLTTDE